MQQIKLSKKSIDEKLEIYIKLDTPGDANQEGTLYVGKRGEGVQCTLRTPQYKSNTRCETSKVKVSDRYIKVKYFSCVYIVIFVKGSVKTILSEKEKPQNKYLYKKFRIKMITCGVAGNYSSHIVRFKSFGKIKYSIICTCRKYVNIVVIISDVKGNVQHFFKMKLVKFNFLTKQQYKKHSTSSNTHISIWRHYTE
jgi:hypothetical protein